MKDKLKKIVNKIIADILDRNFKAQIKRTKIPVKKVKVITK